MAKTVDDRKVTGTNQDPLTKEPGSHPIGTTIGAAGAGALGAVAGAIAMGPIGAVVGGALAAGVGGAVGHEAAEVANPTYYSIEPTLKERFPDRDYGQGRQFEDYQDAYIFGARERERYNNEPWRDELDADLERRWDEEHRNGQLAYRDARPAIRDSWNTPIPIDPVRPVDGQSVR